MKKHGVQVWRSYNDTKSVLSERKILDFRRKLEKYMVHHDSRKWIHVAKNIADSMNKTVTRAHGFKPIDLEKDVANQRIAFQRMYANKIGGVIQEPQLKPPATMRINHLRGVFKKSYIPNFSETEYQLVRVIPKEKPVYELRDAKEPILGKFYPQEIKRLT
jgi:hypothetical protein